MADVKPFRAERYHELRAGPLEQLVAPPYDVISPEERREYLALSPYNVVHLTLPNDEADAARDIAAWRETGVLARDGEPAYWFLAQHYVGPDGVERTRSGLVAWSLTRSPSRVTAGRSRSTVRSISRCARRARRSRHTTVSSSDGFCRTTPSEPSSTRRSPLCTRELASRNPAIAGANTR